MVRLPPMSPLFPHSERAIMVNVGEIYRLLPKMVQGLLSAGVHPSQREMVHAPPISKLKLWSVTYHDQPR